MANSPYIFKIKTKKDIPYVTNQTIITKEFSPMSGSETSYHPSKWNNSDVISSHNCYSYAMGKIVKPLPGNPDIRLSGLSRTVYHAAHDGNLNGQGL